MSEYEPPAGSGVSLRFRVRYEDAPTGDKIGLDFRIGSYIPPFGDIIALDFKGDGYIPPAGNMLALDFKSKSSEIGPSQYLFPLGYAGSNIPTPAIRLQFVKVSVPNIQSSIVGLAKVRNAVSLVGALGFDCSAFGSSTQAFNFNKSIGPQSFLSHVFSTPKIYNLKQFLKVTNPLPQSSYGDAYVQGGVKYLLPRSYDASEIGRADVTNTTANQQVLPKGVERTAVVPAPIVSPHMIYARGIYGTLFGSAKAVPTPVLRQKGLDHFIAGNATVWYHMRSVSAAGFESYATGYPKAFDPTQYFSPSPTLRSSVFGDVRIRNNNAYLRIPSIDSQAISEWATVEARDKAIYAKSFIAQVFGTQSTKNKSPSIFFNGLPAPTFPNQAIGYRIRTVAPTGFDRLGLGKPTVIKTPELFPRSYVGTQFGTQWASNYIRSIEPYGTNHSATGKPTVWFRWRYASPNSWQSSKFGNRSTVTHGVREIIGQGFVRQAYGNAWVSAGVRLLEPLSIVKNQQASNHFVGRHQEIKPVGYVATQFGTRIIPEIQAVYPLGFAGVFGLAAADLYTRHLKPIGYFSTGNVAFRWGRQVVYNLTQHITQNYDGGNGLVPPKWSDWTAIENRNKVIGAIGTSMQRFGYAQIDNGARLLEPQGMIATRFNRSMIAYRIRHLPLQGMEAPYMAGWHIIHNGARVIKPAGEVQSLFGNAEMVSTRRYLDRIGRIESQEFGLGMIAYRIRTLDIEKRYSIAPPIIRLPTVDLYTRYIEFRGYEATKHGLASLSIHFRIITPRWTHIEKSGYPALNNVTPELLTRGHDSQEYGDTKIRTQWRNVDAQGDNTAAIGLLKISDTKQYISVRGFIDSLASQKHTVTQGESAPYSLQYIYLNDENDSSGGDGKGISPPDKQVSNPWLNQNVIYHKSLTVSSRFGSVFMWSNNLTVDGGIGTVEDAVPSPIVSNRNNLLSVVGIDNTINDTKIGKPGLSPHTIYAVVEAPEQAQKNHPPRRLHYVNSSDGTRPAGEVFGRPVVESTIRTLRPAWSIASSYFGFGRPALDLRLKVVKPDGFRLGRWGVPSIPFTPQAIVIRLGIDSALVEKPVVERAPYIGPQYISLKGIYSTVFGATYADNYVRTLHSRGSDSLIMGQRKSGDTPFMWQGLRVGEYVPLIIGGTDTSKHGLTWISLRVRELGADGFDAFRSEYDITDFNGKMTVKNADKKLPSETIVNAIGVEPYNAFGYQDIKLGQHYIRPDGNSDQFRKGGYHA